MCLGGGTRRRAGRSRRAVAVAAATTLAAASAESATHGVPQLRLHAVGVQSEQRGRLPRFTRGTDCIVWHCDGAETFVGEHLDFAVHAGLEQPFAVVERNQHGEHRHVLLHGRLRFDFLDHAAERAIRKSVHGDLRRLAGLHGADVRFVHECARAHLGEVSHRRNDATAAHRLSAGLNDLTDRHRLRDDRAFDGRHHACILELLRGEVEARLTTHQCGLRVRKTRLRRFEVGARDDAILEQRFLTLELRRGDVEIRLRRGQVSGGLLEGGGEIRRVDLHDEIARLHVAANFDRHLHDLARGSLGLHLDHVDHFDDARGLSRHDDVATLNGGGGNRDDFGVGLGARRGDADEGEQQNLAGHCELRMEAMGRVHVGHGLT